jgi:O-antigen ligase
MNPNVNSSYGSFMVGAYLFSVPVFSYSEEMHLNLIPQTIGLLLTIYALYDFLNGNRTKINKTIIIYCLFVLWSIVSYFFSDQKSNTEALITLIKVAIITLCASLLIKNQIDYTRILMFFFLSIFVTVWLNWNDIVYLKNTTDILEEERLAGSFDNANTAALYCMAIFWVGLTLLITKKYGFIFKLILILGILLAVFIILYTGSRKGLIGLGVSSIGISYALYKRYGISTLKRGLIVFVIFSMLVLITRIIYTSPYFYRIETMFQGESSSEVRLYLYTQALNVWQNSLRNIILGIGLGNFQFYNILKLYSHSTITETLVCTGIVGFSLYYLSFFSIVVPLKMRKIVNQSLHPDIILIFIFIIMVFFFSSMAVMYSDRLYWPLLGIVSSYGHILSQVNMQIVFNENESLI